MLEDSLGGTRPGTPHSCSVAQAFLNSLHSLGWLLWSPEYWDYQHVAPHLWVVEISPCQVPSTSYNNDLSYFFFF